ncbi:MAG: HK97 family phage prohead protease [Alphaproteobacteria bacterium]|nr:HK97 family phage prohead protease [Alphaproteobacteria bacterium]
MKLTLPFETKNISEEGLITGYASIFGVIDYQKDQVQKNAFKDNLLKWQRKNKWPKMLWNHNASEPIGVWTKMVEDQNGLYVEGKLLKDVRRGAEIYALLKNGAIDGLSIGYSVQESHFDTQKKCRHLTKIDLHEVSFVTFAANPEAQILSLKNNEIQQLNASIQDATHSLFKFF